MRDHLDPHEHYEILNLVAATLCRHARQSWDVVARWPFPVLFERYDALEQLLEYENAPLED